ncbi:hypothetical protein T11_7874 [Trichinella zimbabwensis]|uniref:Uncharacterized protein n=1 Tax=Trichinella zimbabwensis TaxID=268475 RepID=A0A0V1HG36_9BILA|nr:hypothetical protein T11_7874 [Trichinella zimbabwensis]
MVMENFALLKQNLSFEKQLQDIFLKFDIQQPIRKRGEKWDPFGPSRRKLANRFQYRMN